MRSSSFLKPPRYGTKQKDKIVKTRGQPGHADLKKAWAQTIHMQAAEAIVPLANGYVQGMRTSQCQATKWGQKFVLS